MKNPSCDLRLCQLQVKCLCVLMFLSFPLNMAEIPGPCRHSITREHLLTVRHLMDNQLRNGCSITYTFIERRTLSKCCFVKAALPWILELLTTHFRYNRGSVNDDYVQSLRALILNIYSQKCVPQINEEVEDKPESFEIVYTGSPTEALQSASEVLTVYWELVTASDTPVDWRCRNLTFLDNPVVIDSDVRGYDFKLVFIITSICGGLLFILTTYCLIIQKVPVVCTSHPITFFDLFHKQGYRSVFMCLLKYETDVYLGTFVVT
uniref:Colony stimulating factor 1b (macrophage) n=1 Tax=Echeneis naucrates TaxID=173247 RepID=A0A665TIN1_ECHNA